MGKVASGVISSPVSLSVGDVYPLRPAEKILADKIHSALASAEELHPSIDIGLIKTTFNDLYFIKGTEGYKITCIIKQALKILQENDNIIKLDILSSLSNEIGIPKDKMAFLQQVIHNVRWTNRVTA